MQDQESNVDVWKHFTETSQAGLGPAEQGMNERYRGTKTLLLSNFPSNCFRLPFWVVSKLTYNKSAQHVIIVVHGSYSIINTTLESQKTVSMTFPADSSTYTCFDFASLVRTFPHHSVSWIQAFSDGSMSCPQYLFGQINYHSYPQKITEKLSSIALQRQISALCADLAHTFDRQRLSKMIWCSDARIISTSGDFYERFNSSRVFK